MLLTLFSIFHGVVAVFLDTVLRSVRVVRTSIIFIVGSAPTYLLQPGNVKVDELIRLASDVDDSLFIGGKRDGFTLPAAVDILRNYGVSLVEAVNVFDAAVHKTTAQAITYTFPTTGVSRDRVQLKRVTGTAPSQVTTTVNAEGITGAFTVTGPSDMPTYVLDTDYTYDPQTGIITRVAGGTIAAGGTVEVTYDYADPDLVTDADIIGTVTDGVRSGMQLAFDIRSLRGYRPKIIICPGFSESSTVSTEMESIALTIGYGAIAAIDAPADVSVAEAKAGRAGDAPVTNFGTSNSCTKLFYPRVKLGADVQPLSTHYAGLRHWVDDNFGYHYSASNYPLRNVDGIELENLAEADREDLNIDGITTLYRDFGTGIRLWGNHTALYPSDQTPYSFEGLYRAIGFVHEALVEASLPFVDKPLTPALANVILGTANGFLAQEQARNGAVVNGSEVRYRPEKNPPTQLAAGTIVFSITLMIPVPTQVIRYETELDITLLSDALAQVA